MLIQDMTLGRRVEVSTYFEDLSAQYEVGIACQMKEKERNQESKTWRLENRIILLVWRSVSHTLSSLEMLKS